MKEIRVVLDGMPFLSFPKCQVAIYHDVIFEPKNSSPKYESSSHNLEGHVGGFRERVGRSPRGGLETTGRHQA